MLHKMQDTYISPIKDFYDYYNYSYFLTITENMSTVQSHGSQRVRHLNRKNKEKDN